MHIMLIKISDQESGVHFQNQNRPEKREDCQDSSMAFTAIFFPF